MTGDGRDDAGLPLFYRSLRSIDSERDSGRRFRHGGYAFARTAVAIPLGAEEIPRAASDYPIIFSGGPQPIALAVVGLVEQDNLFVDEHGHWLAGAYLPAWVARYPFILTDDSANRRLVLCVDDESGFLDAAQGTPLFEDGAPTAFLSQAMEFCLDLHNRQAASNEFTKSLVDYMLLEESDARLETPGGVVEFRGVRTISRAQFDQLHDNVILDWRRRGWLELIYAQLQSASRWETLKRLFDRRTETGESALPGFDQPVSDKVPAPGDDAPPSLPAAIDERLPVGFRLQRRPGKGSEY